MNKESHVIEGFYGVYLLYCTNPKYKGKTYIGYTVDPNRRIKQHNKGKQAGGAWRTSNRGPWEMVLIVHGFPNDISALRFEWAWQHPQRSRRLRHVTKKNPREKMYDFCIRILSEMLQVGPWNRLALTIRWLKQDFVQEFPVDLCPPLHMPIAFGPVVSKKVCLSQEVTLETPSPLTSAEVDSLCVCSICYKEVCLNEKITCLSPGCLLIAHTICLAKRFLKSSAVIPVDGHCPACDTHVLWGDLIRKKNNCYNLTVNDTNEDFD